MNAGTLAIHPQIFFKNSKPTSVLLNIQDYKKMLRRIEDFQDIRELERLRKKKLTFRPFKDIRKELGV